MLEQAAGLVFLRRWGVSGPAVAYELGRRGFLTMESMSRAAQRYASLEIQQRSQISAQRSTTTAQTQPT